MDKMTFDRLLSEKRKKLKSYLLAKRGWRCEVCGTRGGITDLHEGIVSREDVRGWKREDRLLIHCAINCFIVCRYCHREHRLSREDAWRLACERYGDEAVREWYEGLPWKAGTPRRF